MAELVVTKCVGDVDVGDAVEDFSRLHGTEFIGIRAYPRLKHRAIVKRPAEDIGSRNDMRSGLSGISFSLQGKRPRGQKPARKKMFHDERQCERDRENHQEIRDSRMSWTAEAGTRQVPTQYPMGACDQSGFRGGSRDFSARIL